MMTYLKKATLSAIAHKKAAGRVAPVLPLLISLLCLFPAAAFASDVNIDQLIELYAPCWFCDLFLDIYTAAGEFSYASYVVLRKDLQGILAIGLGIWLCVNIGEHVGSVAPVDPAEFWRKVTARLFAGVVVAAALGDNINPTDIYGYVMIPIIEGTTRFSAALLDSDCSTVMENAGALSAQAGNAFPASTGEALQCVLRTMNAHVAKGMALGLALLFDGLPTGITDFAPEFGKITSGLLLMTVFFLILIAFPLRLVDAVVRLGIIGALLPLFMVAWVFPSTQGFVGKGFGMLVNSGLVFVSMAVIMGITTAMISEITEGPELTEAIMSGDMDAIGEALLFNALLFPKLLCVCILSYFMIGKATGMADHYGANIGGGQSAAFRTMDSIANNLDSSINKAIVHGVGKDGKGLAHAKIAMSRQLVGERQGRRAGRMQDEQTRKNNRELRGGPMQRFNKFVQTLPGNRPFSDQIGKKLGMDIKKVGIHREHDNKFGASLGQDINETIDKGYNKLRNRERAPEHIRQSTLLQRQDDPKNPGSIEQILGRREDVTQTADGRSHYTIRNHRGETTGMLHVGENGQVEGRDYMVNGKLVSSVDVDSSNNVTQQRTYKDDGQTVEQSTVHNYDGSSITTVFDQDVSSVETGHTMAKASSVTTRNENGAVTNFMDADGNSYVVNSEGKLVPEE